MRVALPAWTSLGRCLLVLLTLAAVSVPAGAGSAADPPAQAQIARAIRSGEVSTTDKSDLLFALLFGPSRAVPSGEVIDAAVGQLTSQATLAWLRNPPEAKESDGLAELVKLYYNVVQRMPDRRRSLEVLKTQYANAKDDNIRSDAYSTYLCVWETCTAEERAYGLETVIAGSLDTSEGIRRLFVWLSKEPDRLRNDAGTSRRVSARLGAMAIDPRESTSVRMEAARLLGDKALQGQAMRAMLSDRAPVPVEPGTWSGVWQARTGALQFLAKREGVSFLPEVRRLLCTPTEFTGRLDSDLKDEATFAISDSMFFLKAGEVLCQLGDPEGFRFVIPFLEHPRKPTLFQYSVLDGLSLRWTWPKERIDREIAQGEHGDPEWAARIDAALTRCFSEPHPFKDGILQMLFRK